MKSFLSSLLVASIVSNSQAQMFARAGYKGPASNNVFYGIDGYDANGRDANNIDFVGLDPYGRAITNPMAGGSEPMADETGVPEEEVSTTIPLPQFGGGGAVDIDIEVPDYDEYLDDDDYEVATDSVTVSQTITEEIFAAVVAEAIAPDAIEGTLVRIALCSGISPLDINFFAFQYEFRGTIIFAGGDAPTVEAIQYAALNDPDCFYDNAKIIGFEFGDDSIMTQCVPGEYLSEGQCKSCKERPNCLLTICDSASPYYCAPGKCEPGYTWDEGKCVMP